MFRTRTCEGTIDLCRPTLSCSVRLGGPALRRFYQRAYSPRLCCGPSSAIVCVHRPLRVPSSAACGRSMRTRASPFGQLVPNCSDFRALSTLFRTTLGGTCRSLDRLRPGVRLRSSRSLGPLLIRLTRGYFRTNVPRRRATH